MATPKSDPKFSKQRVFFLQTDKKTRFVEEKFIYHHSGNMFLIPNCRYHILFVGDMNQLLKKFYAFSLLNHTWTYSIICLVSNRFSGEICCKNVKCFSKCAEVTLFQQKKQRKERNAQYCKKALLRSFSMNHFLHAFLRPTRPTQALPEKLNMVNRIKLSWY